MLEARSAYGYFGVAGGVTGETPPDDRIEKRMPYWEYKNRYSECDTLHDYDKITKPSRFFYRRNMQNGRISATDILCTSFVSCTPLKVLVIVTYLNAGQNVMKMPYAMPKHGQGVRANA